MNRPSLRLLGRALAVLLCLAGPATAVDLKVRTTLQPERVYLGETLVLGVEIEGTQGAAVPDLGPLPDFDVRYRGPSTQVRIVNGAMSASVTHHYLLTPRQVGRFPLGPFRVQHEGITYETAVVQAEVLAADARAPAEDDGPLRLVVQAARQEVFLGEGVPIDVTLYVGAVRVSDVNYPTLQAEGFAAGKFGEPTQTQQVLNGERFQVVRFSTTLTPLRAGELTIGPATMQLQRIEGRRRGFFDDPFFADRRPHTLRAEGVGLRVLPLPEEGRPPGFTGAVGRFTLEGTASPTEVQVGDPVTVQITLRGDGNLDEQPAPNFVEPRGFRTYEPNLLRSEPGLRIFERVLIPNEANLTRLPDVEFSFFHPEERRYVTLRPALPPLVVRPAEGPQKAEVFARGEDTRVPAPEELGRDIVQLRDHPGRFQRREAGFSPAFWCLVGLPPFGWLGVFLFDRRRRRLRNDPRLARQAGAARAAEAGWKRAAVHARQTDTATCLAEIEHTLREYLGARRDLPASRVDAAALRERGLDPVLADAAGSLLTRCEESRYAPESTQLDLSALVAEGERIFREVEKADRRGWGLRARLPVGLLLLFLAPSLAGGTEINPEAEFYRGAQLLAEGQPAAAAEVLSAILAAGWESGALDYNLGNAWFKAGRKGRAILHWERALRALPGDADVIANLEFARSLTGAEECEPAILETLFFPLARRLAPGTPAVVAATLAALAWLAWAVWVGIGTRPPAAARLALALSLVAAWVGASALYQHTGRAPDDLAVVVAEEARSVRFEPADTGTEHYRIAPGSMLRVGARRGDWVQVERCDGRRGWMQSSGLATLAEP